MNNGLPAILAIDPGTQLGWAFRDRLGLITSGTINLKGGRFEGGGMRFLRFRHWLDEMWHDQGPWAAVYFEEVRRHMGVDAAHIYGGIIAVLTAVCEEAKVPYGGIPVGTIKKMATGKGNANKEMMLKAAREQFEEQNVTDDNQADALFILKVGLASITVR